MGELEELGEPTRVRALVERLVDARLVVTQRLEGGKDSVELVHESLISSWPTLRRWLDEGAEDAALLAEIAVAARQWNTRGRSPGLLWRGALATELQRWTRRRHDALAPIEEEFVASVVSHAARARRLRRVMLASTLFVSVAIAVAASTGFVWIRQAEKEAQAGRLEAETETQRAQKAEAELAKKLDALERARRQTQQANQGRAQAEERALKGEKKLQRSYAELERALKAAETSEAKERAAKERWQELHEKESARRKALEKQRSQIQNSLPR
jgi:hypothetical protein